MEHRITFTVYGNTIEEVESTAQEWANTYHVKIVYITTEEILHMGGQIVYWKGQVEAER